MILVTGATGAIGQPLVNQLVAKGAPVRALVRDAAKGRALGCDFAVGDFEDLDSVRTALKGVDKLFLNGPANESMVRQHNAIIDLAKETGVSYIVGLSSAGADAASEIAVGRWHGEIDAHLRASGVAWTILQPGAFLQNIARSARVIRTGKMFGAYGQGRVASIDAADIAACAAALLTGPAKPGESFILTGNEPLTQAEIAQHLSTHLGHEVAYVNMPPEQITASMIAGGVPAVLAQDLAKMQTRIAATQKPWISPAVRELTGRDPRTLDEFLRDNIAAFR